MNRFVGTKAGIVLIFMFISAAYASVAITRTANDVQTLQSEATLADSQPIEPIRLMTSIKPLSLLLNQLISTKEAAYWQLDVLVPPQSSIHDYQFKPSELVQLKTADLFLWLGPLAEPTIHKGLSRFQTPQAALEASELRWRPLDQKGHDHHGHESHQDPHIWLSLPQVPMMLRFMADQILQLLSDEQLQQRTGWTKADILRQQQSIQKQLEQALAAHNALTQKVTRLQSTWVNRRYLSFHNGFGYLDDAFQMQSLGSFVNTPEEGISPRQIRHLQSVVQSQEVGCLILEPAADGRRVESLLDGSLPIVDLDILGNTLPVGVNWLGFWEYLVEQMQVCFGSPAPEAPKQESPKRLERSKPLIKKHEQRILDKL